MAQPAHRGRGEDRNSPRRVISKQLAVEAINLRKAGATYTQIGQKLGVTPRMAEHYVDTALKEVRSEAVEDLRKVQGEQLNAMLLGIWKDATGGKWLAIDRAVRIMERQAALFGLDAPVKVAQTDVEGKDAPKRIIFEVIEPYDSRDDGRDTLPALPRAI